MQPPMNFWRLKASDLSRCSVPWKPRTNILVLLLFWKRWRGLPSGVVSGHPGCTAHIFRDDDSFLARSAEGLEQPLSHSATLPEWLDQPLCRSHSPPSHSEWLSGCWSSLSGRVAEWLLRFREPCCTSTLKCNKHHIIIYIYIYLFINIIYIFLLLKKPTGFAPVPPRPGTCLAVLGLALWPSMPMAPPWRRCAGRRPRMASRHAIHLESGEIWYQIYWYIRLLSHSL